MNSLVGFTAVLGLLQGLLTQSVLASNYPPDYTYQSVRLVHQGPALFAHVGSGIMSKHVIGYKDSGYLAQSRPGSIDAILVSECYDKFGTKHSKTSSLELGREWNGAGYVSFPIAIFNHIPKECMFGGYWSIKVAFSDRNGKWDSRYNQNYTYSYGDLWGRGATPVYFETRQAGPFNAPEVNQAAWQFITSEMRR